jgi:mannose-1-phosphate guanylyltransferase
VSARLRAGIAAGAAFAQLRERDAVVLALAADRVVRDSAAFVAACRQGLAAAGEGHIVTFGVKPERAATEYGYIGPDENSFLLDRNRSAFATPFAHIIKFVSRDYAA